MEKVKYLNINSVLVDNYETRTESLNGVDHMVVPLVMMVEGVHDGSQGPTLYTIDVLSEDPEAWNGVPVTVQHPRNGDAYISANSPEVVSVGRVFNAHIQDLSLQGEAWINLDVLKDESDTTIEYLQNQLALDVSVGTFMDAIEESGDFNNEEYTAIANNLTPDHVALLPGGRGACSWDDGCGVRNNEESKSNLNKDQLKREGGPMETKKEVKVNEKPINPRLEEIFTNETGYRAIGMNIQGKLDSMDNSLRYHYLEELFDNDFIYRVSSRETNTSGYFRVSYEVNENGEVDISNDAVEVRRQVSFEALERRKFTRNKKKVTMTRNKKPCEKVAALIANEATKFTEENREWLEAQDDAVLDMLIPNEAAEEKVVEKKKDDPAPVVQAAEVTEEQIKKVLSNQSEPEKWIDTFVPDGLKDQMKNGLKLHQDKRSSLIEDITNNSNYTKERLENWKTDDLQDLRDSVVPEDADYSLNGLNGNSGGNSKISKGGKSMLNFPKEKATP